MFYLGVCDYDLSCLLCFCLFFVCCDSIYVFHAFKGLCFVIWILVFLGGCNDDSCPKVEHPLFRGFVFRGFHVSRICLFILSVVVCGLYFVFGE